MALPQVGLEAVIANLNSFEAGSKTIQKAYNDINTKAGAVEKATGTLGTSIVGLGNHLLNLGAIAGGAALAGVVALGAGLATFATVGISKAIDLDQQMANIAATMGRTKEAVGPLKDLILDLALDPGLTVNTTQAASAIEKLAQNGLTASQIMDGAAKSTIALANATGDQGFTTSANIATGAMQAFNLEAKDLGTVADGVAGVLVKTKFNADDYALALGNAGEIANTTGVSLQDFNTIIAATASSFTSGSDAGTSLKTLLQRFANPTDEARSKMQELGIAIFDSDGNMRDMHEIVGDLNRAFGDMTEEQKANTAAVIGGADASRTLLGLAGMTSDEFITLSGEVNKNGQALQMAATRVDSLSGVWAIFQGIIEAVQIQVGDKFLPILRDMTVGFTDLASKAGPIVVEFFGGIADTIATMVDKVRGLIDIFGDKGLAGVFASLGFGGSALFLKKLGELVVMMGLTGDNAASLGDIITTTLGGAFTFLTDNLFPMLTQAIEFIMVHFEEFKGALIGIGAVAGAGIFAALIAGIVGLVSPITLVIGAAALLGAAWAGNWGGIQDKTFAVWAVVQPILQQIVDWLQINIPIAIQATVDFWNNTLLPALAVTGTFIMGTVVPAIIELWTWLQTNIPIAIQTVTDFWNNSFLPAMVAVGGFITTFIATLINLNTWLGTNIALAITTVSNIWTTVFLPVITGVWTFISTLLIPLFQSVANVMNAVLGLAITALAGLWQNVLLPVLTVIWHYYTDNIIAVFNQVAQVSKAVLGVAITALTNLWKNTLLPAITSVWSFISGTLIPVFTAAGEAVSTKVAPPINVLVEKILPALSKGLSIVVKWIKEATGFFNGLATAVRNFQLPAVLTPGSPPPFAIALQDIANAAGMASSAMGGFNQTTLDQLLGVQRNVANTRGVIGAAADDVEHFLKNIGLVGKKGSITLTVLKNIFRDNADTILNATDRVAKFKELVEKSGVNFERIFAGGTHDPFGGKGGAISFFISSFDKRKKELEKLQQQIFIQAGKTALTIGNKLNDIVQGSVDILDQRVETLQGLIDSGLTEVNFEGMIISQVQAQELLNSALAEQRDIQDDILQLKQNEQKLSFLEKQLALVETLNQAGLDVKDILGGISLGLDASIPDMIEATNRLVQAMIEQVNKDLQLGSPSKVMMKKGIQTGQGFVEGLMAQIPNIASAMRQAIAGPSLVSGPVLGGGSSSRVVNNNFNMNVNSGASPQAVISQFEIARAMA